MVPKVPGILGHGMLMYNITSAGGESDDGYNPDLLVGELVGYCIRTPAGFWECDETIIMWER